MSPVSLCAAVALASAALSAGAAWRVQDWRHAAQSAQRIEAAAELARNQQKAAQAASEGFEHDKAKTEIRYRTVAREVEKIVERPVYLRECFDADGLQLLNDQIRRADDAGEPGSAMPGLAPGG